MEEDLVKAGLTRNEAKAYLILLKKGSLSANDVARKISMDRTLSYTVLNNLVEKGMVTYVLKEKKKFFHAEKPGNLLVPIRTKEIFVKNLIPGLESIHQETDVIPEIKVYEGKQAVRRLMHKMLGEKSVLTFGSTGRMYDLLHEAPALAKEVIKSRGDFRVIMSKKHSKHRFAKEKLIKIKFLDVKSEATTTVLKNSVIIHLLTNKPIAIEINNKEIAESYRSHFEILWNAAH